MSIPLRWALNIWPLVLGMLLVLGFNRVEHAFMPVVVDFTVTKIEREGDLMYVSGYMRKDRNCVFAGVMADGVMANGEHVSVPLSFRNGPYGNDTSNRPLGTQTWGPWAMTIPVAPGFNVVELESVHSCHPFWATTTRLVSIPILKGDK